MNRILIILISFFLFSACSYEPVLLNKKYDIGFNKISYDGDKEINRIIKSILSQRTSKNKKYDLFFSSKKEKNTILSNKKGDPTTFEIKIILNFRLMENAESIFSDQINKQFTYNNINDKYELSKYEENVLITLTENIVEDMLLSVSSLD